jgi:hypothetical protein
MDFRSRRHNDASQGNRYRKSRTSNLEGAKHVIEVYPQLFALRTLGRRNLMPRLRLPAAMLMGTGQFLLIYGVAVAFLATRVRVANAVIWMLIAGNSIWALACLAMLISGRVDMTLLGNVYVIIQAVTVAALAQLQYLGLRQTTLQLPV